MMGVMIMEEKRVGGGEDRLFKLLLPLVVVPMCVPMGTFMYPVCPLA